MIFRSRTLRLALVLGIASLLGVGCGDGGTETGGAGGALAGVGGLGTPGGSGGTLPSGGAGGSLASGGVLVGAGGLATGGASGGDSATGGVPAAGGIGSGGIGGAVGGGVGDGGSIGTGGGSAAEEWLPVWATTIQSLETGDDKVPPSLPGNTMRQFIWPTLSGDTVRMQLSNEKGASAMDIAKVHIALAKNTSDPVANAGQIDAATDVALTFNGQPNISIPAGETVWSDGVAFPLQEMKLTAISIQFGSAVPSNVTFHPGSRTTSYFATGDAVTNAAAGTLGTRPRWYVIDTLEAMEPADASAIACLGDSITDGYGIINTFQRWTDAFTLALKTDPALATKRSVLNFGMGGNMLTKDQTYQDSGVKRFERDVLNSDFSSKIKYLIVMEGVNDINASPAVPAATITAAYQDIVTRARAKGITVFVSPLTPMNAQNKADRGTINQTVRAADYYDPGVDFDIAIRDPNNQNNTLTNYKNDDLHPSAAGYKAMADSIDLTLFH